ncbi:4-hydroxythreonine-4-phosphate dehydrogenase PdxA [Candidatus Cloacimonadota bacterium]
MKKIAVTTGDPAGIGPEITTKALRFYQHQPGIVYIVYGRSPDFKDGNIVKKISDPDEAVDSGVIYSIEIDDQSIIPGKQSVLSGKISLEILQRCAEDLNKNKIHAVVTCPISKHEIRKTDPNFIGHTEFFAYSSNTPNVVMSFWGPYFNLALLTTHLALCDVSKALNRTSLLQKFKLIYQYAKKMLNDPQIAILALNPHAGEQGAFGNEDELITSVLAELKKTDINIDGPYPADTFFSTKAPHYDLIISAYHDQGLIPFKMISNNNGVNATLGLPYIRTSVDHGTAFDIAGLNIASEQSLEKAINMAEKQILPTVLVFPKTYDLFAQYYDQYMNHVNYEDWIEFLLNQYIKKNRHNPGKILELACGTANISCRLVKRDLHVEATDISSEMLKIASEKPFAPHLSCRNMLSPVKENSYDLIILLFDSINYLLKEAQINILLANISKGLKDDGLFIFDISTVRNCEENFDGFINLEDNEDQYLIHHSDLNYDNMIQTTYLTFFELNGFLYKRNDEIHKQKIYKTSEIISFIENSDLILAGIYCMENNNNLLGQDPEKLDRDLARLFFVLEKNAV